MSNVNHKIKNLLRRLPKTPGVYLMKNKQGKIIYVGKAGVLKNRVSSYFQKAHNLRLEQMVGEIADIKTQKTSTIIEALILEANLIKKFKPKYNIREKDDKSFLYVVFTRDEFPKIELWREPELRQADKKKIKAVFGPFTSSSSLREALKILRKIFPWSNCEPKQKRPCFYYQLGLCPGICANKISPQKYAKTIRRLILFFQGKKSDLIKRLKKEMAALVKKEKFEQAADIRDQLFALEHIQDIALIKKSDQKSLDIFGRIEGYDISNISGVDAVGSIVVFTNAKADKNEYRKFKIKTVKGQSDTAMIKEVLARRFKNSWPRPDLILIDGGRGQINAVKQVLREFKLTIPVVGIAKGPSRKKDEFITGGKSLRLKRLIENNPELLKQVRDEAHRFAVAYHRLLRKKRLIKKN